MTRLKEELLAINRSLHPKPVIPLTISYGDEVAGLFASPMPLHDVVWRLRGALLPDLRFRFVACRGRIAVASKDIREVGGEVFKRASQAMRSLKAQDRFCRFLLGNALVDPVLDSLARMSNALIEEMTPYQRTVFGLLEQGKPHKDIARELGKYPQSVSQAAKAGKADLILAAQQAINVLLASEGQRGSVDSRPSIAHD